MPAKAPVTSIECASLSHLLHELASVQDALSCTETEDTWEAIARALSRFAALCNGNGSTYPADLVSAIRTSSRPINSALNSERTRLSGTATDFMSTAVNALGRAFEPLVPHYLPVLLTLCTRANKVFVTRAKECIHAIIEHTQSPSILHYLVESVKDKSVSLRLASAEAVVLCLNSFNPPDLEKESRAKEIEAIIRVSAVDANADVRKVARKIFDAYKILLPGRVQSFTDPLTPTIRKYLDIKATAHVRSQPPSRPTSSHSARSAPSENLAPSHGASSRPHPPSTTSATATTAPVRPSRHTRTISTSSTTAKRPPTRTPTPEVDAPSQPPQAVRDPPRRAREEPKRVGLAKLDMPPPDYIPTRPAATAVDSGPQRPLSATDLYFPPHHHPDRERAAPSGPQRVALADPFAPSTSATTTVRSGPIRPAMMPVKPQPGGEGAERKERVVGGARRVLRLPDPTTAESAHPEEKEKPAHSGPIRPRVISTSRSTPAIPLHAANAAAKEREDALKAKKLASSQGASGRPGGAASAAVTLAARHARTASGGGVQGSTASARARAAEREKEKTQVQEKERTQGLARKPSSRTLPSSKPVVPSRPGAAGAASTVTVRERTRTVSSAAVASKPVARDSARSKASAGTRSRAGTQEPPSRAQSVSPAEVPLPESSKAEVPTSSAAVTEPVAGQAGPSDEAAEQHSAAVESIPAAKPEEAPAVSKGPSPAPENIPLPPSGSTSPSKAPAASPAVNEHTIDPHTSSTEEDLAPAHLLDSDPTPPAESLPPPLPLPIPIPPQEARTPEHQRVPHRAAAVEQTPISALVASIERGFFAMRGVPLSPMREEDVEDESMVVIDSREDGGEADPDARVFEDQVGLGGGPGRAVEPLFVRRTRQAVQA